MTLTRGHGCDIDKQKFVCLQDKVRTTQPITTKLDSYISLVMLSTWLDFEGILLETLFLSNFLWKFRMCFFQGQTLYWTYLRNGWSDWYETKRRCIGWILGELCDLHLWPHPWPWPCSFKVKVWNRLIWGMGWGVGVCDWHGSKGMWVNHSWPWLWPMGNHGGVGGCTI